jgi:hypothetical protein
MNLSSAIRRQSPQIIFAPEEELMRRLQLLAGIISETSGMDLQRAFWLLYKPATK